MIFLSTAVLLRTEAGSRSGRRPARVAVKLTSSAYPNCGSSYQFSLCAIPHPVLPLVTTPVTVSSWGWQLHRRVQLHRHQTCGNCLNEAPKARSEFCRTAPRTWRRRLPAAKRRDGGIGAWLFAYFLATESRSAWRAETRLLHASQACRPNKKSIRINI